MNDFEHIQIPDPLSFEELDAKTDLTAAEVWQTLSQYGVSGAAIDAEIVMGLIDRTDPDLNDLAMIIGAANGGAAMQAKKHEFSPGQSLERETQYQTVADHALAIYRNQHQDQSR